MNECSSHFNKNEKIYYLNDGKFLIIFSQFADAKVQVEIWIANEKKSF